MIFYIFLRYFDIILYKNLIYLKFILFCSCGLVFGFRLLRVFLFILKYIIMGLL